MILIPSWSENIGIYDPGANVYTDGPALNTPDYAFSGGVLAPNGKIYLVPRRNPNIGIYDPIANTYTNGPAHNIAGGDAYFGGVLVPSGKIVLSPYYNTNIGVIDLMGTEISRAYCMHPYLNKF